MPPPSNFSQQRSISAYADVFTHLTEEAFNSNQMAENRHGGTSSLVFLDEWIRELVARQKEPFLLVFGFYGPKLTVGTLLPGQTGHVAIALETSVSKHKCDWIKARLCVFTVASSRLLHLGTLISQRANIGLSPQFGWLRNPRERQRPSAEGLNDGLGIGVLEGLPYISIISAFPNLIPVPENRSLFTIRQVKELSLDPVCEILLFFF